MKSAVIPGLAAALATAVLAASTWVSAPPAAAAPAAVPVTVPASAAGVLDGAAAASRYPAQEAALRADGWSDPPGRVLGYDPRGEGRVLLVFGELDAAAHIAVLVPGSGWDLAGLLRDGGRNPEGPVAMARTLHRAMAGQAPDTPSAVVLWLGYDTPEGIDLSAARSERAEAAATPLAAFTRGLLAGAHVSLLGHSYGAVAAARAVAAGARADELALFAAPGTGADSARDLPTRVWAARTADDPMRFVPPVRFAGFGHGPDPVDAPFGAHVFRTGTARGHAGYLEPGTESLTNLARIALARPDEVTLDER